MTLFLVRLIMMPKNAHKGGAIGESAEDPSAQAVNKNAACGPLLTKQLRPSAYGRSYTGPRRP